MSAFLAARVCLLFFAASLVGQHDARAARLRPSPSCESLSEVTGLPVVELRSKVPSDSFAVIVTGDGGWRATDRSVARAFLERGYDVVGLVSPKYFREQRTADEASCALNRILHHYSIEWRKDRVVLVGYSRGAGALPFMVSRLPEREKSEVSALALLSLDPTIAFHYSPLDLFRRASRVTEIPVRSELDRLRGIPTLCFYGINDEDSLCPALPDSVATTIPQPGGHRLQGNWETIVDRVLREARPLADER